MRLLAILATLLVALATSNVHANSTPSLNSAGLEGPEAITPGPQPAAVPTTGKMFVLTKNSPLGNTPYFGKFAAAAQKTQETGATLPATLVDYSCVVLSINLNLPQSDIDAVAAYARAGGNVLAIGEWDAYPQANAVMNKVAEASGSANRLRGGAFDLGYHSTENIDPSTLTLGVTKLTYAATGKVEVGGAGFPMAKTGNGAATYIAGEQVGLGYLVMSAEWNTWSDFDNGGYATASNGALANNFCNGVVALGLPDLL